MNFCIPYSQYIKSNKKDKIKEILISYNKDKNFLDILASLQEKIIDIDFYYNAIEEKSDLNECELQKLQLIAEKFNLDIRLRISEKDLDKIDLIKKYNFPFFVYTWIRNWDILRYYSTLGVCSMYIVESLGFELDKVKTVALEKNFTVRVFPDVAQSFVNEIQDIYKFFIRPEDLDFYSQFIDVIEFFRVEEKHNVLLDIYLDKVWMGPLDQIIIGFKENVNNQFLPSELSTYRATCGKRCFQGYPCNICPRAVELSKLLEENGLQIVRKDEKNGKRTTN